MDRLGPRDLLLVISDHGFRTFRRCVNLNAWLRDNGYLAFKKSGAEAEHLESINWTETRAYSFGLSGIYLNIKGREAEGIVEPVDVEGLVAELCDALEALSDPETGKPCVKGAYPARTIYHGPYVERAPDVVVGFADGYRSSWENAVGRTDGPVFSNNERPWGGDHCMDRSVVPGVLFSNCVAFADGAAAMEDIAPTCLEALGVAVPQHLDGHSLWQTAGKVGRG
jgi:predicted AlkP superfamily phosphohydrolase/phosphomutase